MLAERDVGILGFRRYFLNRYASLNDFISDNPSFGLVRARREAHRVPVPV